MAAQTPASAIPGPMGEINMTPLIDVMLVLLIMFIVTIPIQSHAVKLDLPARRELPVMPDPLRNTLIVTAGGQILWNGTALTKGELHNVLAATQQMRPVPELHVRPEPEARYELVDEVLALTKVAGVERMGFVGNERYSRF